MEMSNLWEETINFLKEKNKTWEDIKHITSIEETTSLNPQIFYISKDYFYKLSKDLDYNRDFGINHINKNITLWGENFFIERNIYDGREEWIYKLLPISSTKEKSSKKLIVSSWDLDL